MAKVIVDVLLKEGTDETTFINDVTSHSEVDLKNRMPNTPTIVVLKVEESYLDTLRSHSSVVSVEVEPVLKHHLHIQINLHYIHQLVRQ